MQKGFSQQEVLSLKFAKKNARVSTNVMLRDLDISPPHSTDGRRLEVVAEGLCFVRVPACLLLMPPSFPRFTEMAVTERRNTWSCVEGGKNKQRSHVP